MALARWLAGRIAAAAFVLWVVATVVFFALRAAGGDPSEAILGGPGSQAGPEAMARVREEYSLDEPLIMQYLMHIGHIFTLQFGDSYARRQPVAALIGGQITGTLLLAAVSLALAWILALGVASATLKLKVRAAVGLLRAGEIIASVLPHFWFGAVLTVIFAVELGWLPATSAGNSPSSLLLPAVTLAVPVAGFLGQVTRDSLAEAHFSPFATAARARGAGEQWIFWHHSLRHAALPAIALSGWAFGSLLSGAVVVETLFARPGLGRLLIDATHARDVPLVIGVVLVVALGYVVVMAVSDGVERVVDPRPRDREARRSGASSAAANVEAVG